MRCCGAVARPFRTRSRPCAFRLESLCEANEEVESCIDFVKPGQEQPTASNLDAQTEASRAVDASACDGPATTNWLVVNRFRACRVGEVVKPFAFPADPTSVSVIRVRTFERLVLDPKDDVIQYRFSFERISGFGRLGGASVRFKVSLRCAIRVCSPGTTQEEELAVSQLQPNSGWSSLTVQSPIGIGSDPILSRNTDLRPKWTIDLRDIPDLGVSVDLDTPPFRCDSAPELNYYSVGDQRRVTEGCVFPFAEIPTMQLPLQRYPNHGALVRRGQRVISGSPGNPNGKLPLTRTPRLTENARKASQLCEQAGVRLTCDEYAYAATQEGCGWSGWRGLPGPPCVVADMTKTENSGAGGYLQAFLRRQRIMYGDRYFVTVS